MTRIILSVVFTTITLISLNLLAKHFTNIYHIANLNYSVENKDSQHRSIPHNVTKSSPNIEIEFDFKVSGYNELDNIFDTSKRHQGLRMEFNKAGDLGLVTNSGKDIVGTVFTNKNTLGTKYHRINIKIQNNVIVLKLDNQEVHINQPTRKVEFTDLLIGYGFDESRFFTGNIKNFSLTYREDSRAANLIKIIQFAICIYMIVYLRRQPFAKHKRSLATSSILQQCSKIKSFIRYILKPSQLYLLLISIFLLLHFFGGYFINTYSIHDLKYDVDKKNVSNTIIPAEFANSSSNVRISFDFKKTGYNQHDNIFDTSETHQGIRMEFNKTGDLGLVTHSGENIVGTLISKNSLNSEYNNVELQIRNNTIFLKINGKEINVAPPKEEIQITNLNVGYGFDQTRYFSGRIKNFDAHFFSPAPFISFIKIALLVAIITSFAFSRCSLFISKSTLYLSPPKLLVILVLLVISTYSFNALNSFFLYQKSVSPNAIITPNIFHFFLKNEINKDYVSFFTKPLTKEDDIPSFFITINKTKIKELNSDLPTSGKNKSYTGFIKIDNGKSMKMKMRYRGEGNFHWFYPQKSLRINLKKGNLYNMEKKFNLINPQYLHGFRDIANYKIAHKLGIISPDSYPIKVFINGEYKGVYLYLSQVDESLLRKHKAMPGSVYYGDSGAPMNSSGYTDLWLDSKYWVKKASRNKEQKHIRDDIELFIQKINNSTEKDFYNFFNQYINKQKFYNFISLDRIVGSGHHDINHNHKIYFDPYLGKFEPIEWDIRFWGKNKYKDSSYYPLIHRINFNPILSYELDKITYSLYQRKLDEEIYEIYKRHTLNAKMALEADQYKDTAIPIRKLFNNASNAIYYSVPYIYEEQLQEMKKDQSVLKERKKIMMNFFENADFKLVSLNNDEKTILKYYVAGHVPIKINFAMLANQVSRVHDGISTPLLDQKDIIYPGKIITSNNQSVILRGDKKIIDAYEEYIFIIDDKDFSLDKISYTNAITNSNVSVENVHNFTRTSESLHPWTMLENVPETIMIEGNIDVTNDLFFEAHQNVIIKAGTNFTISPEKSIYFFGKVTAAGTKTAPIKFLPRDLKTPWGSIVVQGKGSNGSSFNYIEVSGGSVTENSLIKYTAQFNIHDNDNFVIEHSVFDRNSIGDDNLHIAYAEGRINSSVFSNSNSDAVDVDISNIQVTNSVFISSGNDGLDIMTTKLKANGNIFIDSGDKGISVGEWSDANIEDSIIYNAYIGLAAKDKSTVSLNKVIFASTKSETISAYNKNSKYDEGGFITGHNISIIGQKKIVSDKKSNIDIVENKNILPIRKSQWSNNLHYLPKAKQNILLNLY